MDLGRIAMHARPAQRRAAPPPPTASLVILAMMALLAATAGAVALIANLFPAIAA